MGRLDKAVRKAINELDQEAKKIQKVGIVGYWKRRKIISSQKWEKMRSKALEYSTLLGYIPEDYLEYPLPTLNRNEKINEEIQSWGNDWYEYLHKKKRPSFGEVQCNGCVLNPKSGSLYDEIRNIALKGIGAEFPCNVINIYECPFKEDKNKMNTLFALPSISNLMGSALYKRRLPDYYEHTFVADFEKDSVQVYRNFHLNPKPNSGGRLDKELSDLKEVEDPIRGVEDIFKIVTSKSRLTKILEEHINSIKSTDSKPEYELESTMSAAIDYFDSIKDTIKIEDVRDFSGRDLNGEKLERERIEQLYETFAKDDEATRIAQSKPRNGSCIECNKFANILCTNCNKWVCFNHWRKHKEDHTITKP